MGVGARLAGRAASRGSHPGRRPAVGQRPPHSRRPDFDCLLLFYMYGHVYTLLESASLAGLQLGRHRLLAPLWLGATLVSAVYFRRSRRSWQNTRQVLNVMALTLLVLPLGQIGLYAQRSFSARLTSSETVIPDVPAPDAGLARPDVYYIILDAYTRQDAMQKLYGMDNTPFLNDLAALGFTVASCAQSNYAQTQLSLASSLNMDYLPALGEQYTPAHSTRAGIQELIEHNAVRKILERYGYRTIAFETGFKGTQWQDAAEYYSPAAGWLEQMELGGGLNGFEVLLLRSTAGLIVADGAASLPRFLQPELDNPRQIHYNRILFVLDKLKEISLTPGPKFVFVHLVIPHPPYVFGADGEYLPLDQEDAPGYSDQVRFINSRMLPLLEQIIANAAIPPVIILQGDHGGIGSAPQNRMRILNALYLSPQAAARLYPAISPVNTFRIFFDTYFGLDYPLLEDTAYFSVYNTPFDFTIIPNSGPGCQ